MDKEQLTALKDNGKIKEYKKEVAKLLRDYFKSIGLKVSVTIGTSNVNEWVQMYTKEAFSNEFLLEGIRVTHGQKAFEENSAKASVWYGNFRPQLVAMSATDILKLLEVLG